MFTASSYLRRMYKKDWLIKDTKVSAHGAFAYYISKKGYKHYKYVKQVENKINNAKTSQEKTSSTILKAFADMEEENNQIPELKKRLEKQTDDKNFWRDTAIDFRQDRDYWKNHAADLKNQVTDLQNQLRDAKEQITHEQTMGKLDCFNEQIISMKEIIKTSSHKNCQAFVAIMANMNKSNMQQAHDIVKSQAETIHQLRLENQKLKQEKGQSAENRQLTIGNQKLKLEENCKVQYTYIPKPVN